MNWLYFCLIALLWPFFSLAQMDEVHLNDLKQLPNGTEIALGFYNKGDLITQGFILKHGKLSPVNNSDKLFEIGSVTKIFTTLSSMMVLDKKNIPLDTSIKSFLPEDNADDINHITYRKLMTHSSGLPKYPRNIVWSVLRSPSQPVLHYSDKRLYRYLKNYAPKLKDTSIYQYSNLGMGILGHITSQLMEEDLNTIVTDEILDKLEMNNTCVGVQNVANQKVKNSWEFSEITVAAGGMISTVNDLLTFQKTVILKNAPDEKINLTLAKMETKQFPIKKNISMAIGWKVNHTKNSIYYHGGVTRGHKSILAIDLEHEKGIVILTNAKGLTRKENKILKKVVFGHLNDNEQNLNTFQ